MENSGLINSGEGKEMQSLGLCLRRCTNNLSAAGWVRVSSLLLSFGSLHTKRVLLKHEREPVSLVLTSISSQRKCCRGSGLQ